MIRSLIVALLLPLPAMAWPWTSEPQNKPAPPRPVASIILDDSPTQTHSLPGAIRARTEVALAFQTLGRMTTRQVDVGAVVTKGQLLATLDPQDLQAEVRAAQAAAGAALVDYETALATTERTRALVKRNVATMAQLEQAEQALASAQASRDQTQSELVRARGSEGYAEMRAPFDGVISAVEATPGAVVNAGQAVMQLSSQERLEAVIDLQPAMISRIRPGDEFEIWSENHPELISKARVSRIEPVADVATRTRRVRLELNRSDSFRLGALIRARPASGGLRQIAIPTAAVLLRDGKPNVWVVQRQGDTAQVALHQIKIRELPIPDLVTVTEGLSPGEEIVIRGVHSLVDNQPVGASVTP